MALRPETLNKTKAATWALCEFTRNDIQLFNAPYDGPSLKAARLSKPTNLLLGKVSESIAQVRALEQHAAAAMQKLENFRWEILRKLTYLYLLPPEILCYIFRLAYDSFENIPERSKFALCVSHVSRTWRSTALQQRELWCSVDLIRGPRPSIEGVELFVARSNPRPINVYVDGTQHPYKDAAVGWTSEQMGCDRWKSLLLNSNDDDMLSILKRPLPALESLEIVSCDQNYHTQRVVWGPMKSPPLRRFVYDSPNPLAVADPYPRQLMELVLLCEVRLGDLVAIFESCPQLQLCQVGSLRGLEADVDLRPPSGLETLVLERLPSRYLIRFLRCALKGEWKTLLHLGLNSYTPFAGVEQTEELRRLLLAFFPMLPALTELCVYLQDRGLASVVLEVITCTGKGVSLLPNLRCLKLPRHRVFGLPENWEVRDDQLVNLISSRTSQQAVLAGVVGLDSVGVRWRGEPQLRLKTGYSKVKKYLVRYHGPWWIRRMLSPRSPSWA